jgi:hypothetical protein
MSPFFGRGHIMSAKYLENVTMHSLKIHHAVGSNEQTVWYNSEENNPPQDPSQVVQDTTVFHL